MIEILPVLGIPIIQLHDNIGKLIVEHFQLQEKDVIIIAHTIVSRAEGCVVKLEEVNPSQYAKKIAKQGDKDPRLVEVILNESKTIVRMNETLLITETKHGFVCANSGVDRSNAELGMAVTLPKDPDKSAKNILKEVKSLTNIKELGVIISDTFGRPFRIGTTNVAIGVAGIEPLVSYLGKKDLFGYEMQYTTVARADELATAAGLIMGQGAEGIPVVIVRGAEVVFTPNEVSASELNRPRENALFW